MKKILCLILCTFLAAPVLAADFFWRPIATNVRQLDEHDFSGLTIAAGNQITFSCNGKDLVLTVGTDITPTEVAAECASMIDAANRLDGILTPTTDESRNFGGEEIPEFYEVDAYSVAADLYIESKTPGVPFTITVTENATGAIATTNITPATGEQWVSNADNWRKADGTTGALPDDADTMYFDAPAADASYGLDVFQTGNREVNFVRTTDYGGNIGLPLRRYVATINKYYFEYRNTHLELDGATLSIVFSTGVTPMNQGITKLDLESETTTLQIQDAGAVGTEPTVYLKGGTYTTTEIFRGFVIIDDPSDPPTVGAVLGQMNIGRAEALDCKLILGKSAAPSADTNIFLLGGEMLCYSDLNHGANSWYVTSRGAFNYYGGDTDLIFVRNGGTFSWLGGGGELLEDLEVYHGGTVLFSGSQLGLIFTGNVILFPGATLDARTFGSNPFFGVGTDLIIRGGDLNDVTILRP